MFTGQYENHWFGFSGKQMLRWSLLCRIFLKNCLGVNTHGKKGMKAESGRDQDLHLYLNKQVKKEVTGH